MVSINIFTLLIGVVLQCQAAKSGDKSFFLRVRRRRGDSFFPSMYEGTGFSRPVGHFTTTSPHSHGFHGDLETTFMLLGAVIPNMGMHLGILICSVGLKIIIYCC